MNKLINKSLKIPIKCYFLLWSPLIRRNLLWFNQLTSLYLITLFYFPLLLVRIIQRNRYNRTHIPTYTPAQWFWRNLLTQLEGLASPKSIRQADWLKIQVKVDVKDLCWSLETKAEFLHCTVEVDFLWETSFFALKS